MRKRSIFGILGAVAITSSCLFFAINSGPQIEPIALATATDLEATWEPFTDNPKIVALEAFDPEVLLMSYPPQYSGIPLLVGSVAQNPLGAARCAPLFIEERVTLDFDGDESGDLLWEGWISWAHTPRWVEEVVQHFQPLLLQNANLLRCQLYYVGSVHLLDAYEVPTDDSWLIYEQRHFLIQLTPCYETVKAKAGYQLEENYYASGEVFEFHVATLKYRLGSNTNEAYLKDSTFVGVFEK